MRMWAGVWLGLGSMGSAAPAAVSKGGLESSWRKELCLGQLSQTTMARQSNSSGVFAGSKSCASQLLVAAML
jgi:hypothetical protein